MTLPHAHKRTKTEIVTPVVYRWRCSGLCVLCHKVKNVRFYWLAQACRPSILKIMHDNYIVIRLFEIHRLSRFFFSNANNLSIWHAYKWHNVNARLAHECSNHTLSSSTWSTNSQFNRAIVWNKKRAFAHTLTFEPTFIWISWPSVNIITIAKCVETRDFFFLCKHLCVRFSSSFFGVFRLNIRIIAVRLCVCFVSDQILITFIIVNWRNNKLVPKLGNRFIHSNPNMVSRIRVYISSWNTSANILSLWKCLFNTFMLSVFTKNRAYRKRLTMWS